MAQKGKAIAEETNNLSKLIFLYQALANNYKAGGQFEKRSEALEKLLSLKDSLAEKNSVKEIADIAARYELQKKENIIIQQQYALQRNRVIAIGSIVLFVLGTVLAWLLYRNYRLVQQKKYTSLLAEQMVRSEKEIHSAKENERKRISADLHDNLGAHAAAITSNVKYLKEESEGKYENLICQLDENAQNIVTQLNETIWVLKHESLPITTLADRYKLWMQRLMKNYPDVKYHYSESIKEDLEFSPTKILHIFFILKECVTNALKHSLCTELTINIISDKTWEILIQDNGIGIDLDKVPPYRGLHNISSRAKDCGCSVIWGNVKPSGTSVTISGATTN